jgi:hypothetical protein
MMLRACWRSLRRLMSPFIQDNINGMRARKKDQLCLVENQMIFVRARHARARAQSAITRHTELGL